jgi:radical SAM protein with 4Fe4S-binding SPASM domain
VFERALGWLTPKKPPAKSPTEVYPPIPMKLAFQTYLGLGWYGIEEGDDGTRVWSRNIAEIRIAPDVTRVVLSFTSHYYQWTGSPQTIEFSKDGIHDFTLQVTTERTVVTVNCKGNHLISIRTGTAKPSQFRRSSDCRALGICLDQLVVEPLRVPALSEQKESWLLYGESNPTGMPNTLQLEITSACNLKCTMCTNHAVTNPNLVSLGGHMNGSLWDKIRPILRDVEVLFLLGDGEVFAHPHFLSYVEEADSLGVQTVFSTNGQLLNAERIERIAALQHLFRMTLSIDSPDPEIYRRIRGTSLAPVMQALREMGRRSPLADRICVNAVVMKKTLPSLQQFPQQLAEMGLKNLVLRGLLNYDFTLDEECPEYNDDDLRMLRNIKEDCTALGVQLSLMPPIPGELVEVSRDERHQDLKYEAPQPWSELTGPQTKQCFDPWLRAVITRDGSVHPCEAFGLPSGPLGNLTTENFDQIWNGERFTRLRQDLLQGRQLGCANCVRRQTGPHPLQHFAARIVREKCWSSEKEISLTVRNTGAFTWTQEVQLYLGTSGQRDRTDSVYYHPQWISRNRVCTFTEEKVAPGEQATFRCPISKGEPQRPERFQLVFDGRLWLPSTQFQLPFATQ